MESEWMLSYDLQFFAKDGEGGEKTEEPTAKKLGDARKKGQVAKSKELSSAATLIIFFVMLKVLVSTMYSGFVGIFDYVYNRIPDILINAAAGGGFSASTMQSMNIYVMLRIIILSAPYLIAGFVAAIVIGIVQVKWQVSLEPLKPNFSRLNPVNGFKRMFSVDSVMELLKSVVKVVLIVYIAYSEIKDNAGTLFVIYDIELLQAIILVGSIIINTGIKISAVYIVIGVADFAFQKWKFKDEMKMTKQEVKDEFKNTEGDPQIKGRQRRVMQEASRRRMMQDVPKADVVITNPTHLAVAIRYDTSIAKAPIVVAKGEDYLAQKIKEVARDNDVEIVENKPLARMLYATVDLGQEIPPELYQSVAEVLAMVYNLKNKTL